MYYACVFLLFFEIYRHFATAISSEKLAAMPAFYTKLNFEYVLTFAFNCRKSFAGKRGKRNHQRKYLDFRFCNQKSAYDLLITDQYSSFKNIFYQWVDF